MEIQGKSILFFGTRKRDRARINISKPTFDCGWYWSFGYLGNKYEHYHLSSYQQIDHRFELKDGSFDYVNAHRNINLYDALLEDYNLCDNIQNNLWQFCELALSIYKLKEAAELFHIGGAHMTTNVCQDLIKNEPQEHAINKHVLPVVLQEFWNLVSGTDDYQPVKANEYAAAEKALVGGSVI